MALPRTALSAAFWRALVAWTALTLGLAAATRAGELQLVAPHAAWRYLDDGSDAGTLWRTAAFDDSSWPAGEAQLGYGDGDEITIVRCRVGLPEATQCSGTGPRITTTYFRRRFETEDPARWASLTLRLMADDGAVVYLNGQEVVRKNMPEGEIFFDTLAHPLAQADENVFFDYLLAPALFAPGTNIVAAEVHQWAPESSDASFALEIVGEDPLLPELLRGPYLQLGTATTAVVRWRTDTAVPTRLEIGSAPGTVDATFFDAVAKTEHEVPLTGLLPETPYFYAAGTDAGRLAGFDDERCFVTAPPTGEPRGLRVWVIGDSGTANVNAAAVRDAYRRFAGAHASDLWLMLGDNAYSNGTDAEYQAAVFDMYPTFLERSWLWPAIGNHDSHSFVGGGGPYFDLFTLPKAAEAGGLASGTEAYYSFDYANVHFLCLDSQDMTGLDPTSAMLAWLAADLAATDQDWIVAFWHHPPYSKGSHDSDNPADSLGRLVAMRELALPILEAGGVDLVLTGHSHAYERSMLLDGHYGSSDTLHPAMIVDGGDGRPGGDGAYDKSSMGARGAVYTVAGSSGRTGGGTLDHPAMVVAVAELGSMILDFDDRRLDATFLRGTGTIGDEFTLTKEGILFADGFESGSTSAWSSIIPPWPAQR